MDVKVEEVVEEALVVDEEVLADEEGGDSTRASSAHGGSLASSSHKGDENSKAKSPKTAGRAGGAEEDPLAILRPGRKKLGSLEAERIIAVVDACIAKLRLIPVEQRSRLGANET